MTSFYCDQKVRSAVQKSTVTTKRLTTALLKDRGVFGKLSLVKVKLAGRVFAAVSDVRAAAVQKSTITQVIQRRPEFAVAFSFSERLRQSDEVIESLPPRSRPA